jgi:hypothetical protein
MPKLYVALVWSRCHIMLDGCSVHSCGLVESLAISVECYFKPVGKSVTTTGAVNAPFRFKGEHDLHDLKFPLLPDCIHNVILVKSFLKLTDIFSKLSNFYCRVKESLRVSHSSISYTLAHLIQCLRGLSTVSHRLRFRMLAVWATKECRML